MAQQDNGEDFLCIPATHGMPPLTNDDVEQLFKFYTPNSTLRYLDISGDYMCEDTIAKLFDTLKEKGVERINELRCANSLRLKEFLRAYVSKFGKTTQQLNLSCNDCFDKECMSQLEHCTDLEYLDLCDTGVEWDEMLHDDFMYKVVEKLPKLKRINLVRNDIDHYVGEKNYPNLKKLMNYLYIVRQINVETSDKFAQLIVSSGVEEYQSEEDDNNALIEDTSDIEAEFSFISPTEESKPKEYNFKYLENLQEWGQDGKGVKVAVLDTGCDIFNPFFSLANIISVKSFVPNQHAFIDPKNHGTHCAGIVVKHAKNVELYIGKVLGDKGKGSPESLIEGIKWAISKKVKVISLSLGFKSYSVDVEKVIQGAMLDGIIVICAAANDGHNTADAIQYPGRYGNTICVGSCGPKADVSSFSSIGREIDLVAPGDGVDSAMLVENPDWNRGPVRGVGSLSGTSMACPFVAAIVSLLLVIINQHFKQHKEWANTTTMKSLLRRICVHDGSHDSSSGYGTLSHNKCSDWREIKHAIKQTRKYCEIPKAK